MGDIFTDFVDDISIKPKKSKTVIKWVIRISVLLITGAFIAGQFKISRMNKINQLEKSLNDNTKAILELKSETNKNFLILDAKIDKVYDDGLKTFNDFQSFNNEQLKLIIDYGQTNKELVKKMLEVNSMKKTEEIQNNIEVNKKRDVNVSIEVKKTDANGDKK